VAKRILIPLPERDFDPTEAAVSWRILVEAGFEVEFATPRGLPAEADPLMLSGEGLDAWSRIPALRGVKLLGLILRANADARRDHQRMIGDARYRSPLAYGAIVVSNYNGLLLPGGHCARGMRAYLESEVLQARVAEFFDRDLPVAAICHGVVLAARSRSTKTGLSVLHGRKTTALTWKLERTAWSLMRYGGRFWDAEYYRTYVENPGEPAGFRSVEEEVKRALASPADFLDAPASDVRKSSGLFRDTDSNARPAFVVVDRAYVSARWPGDAHEFAQQFAKLLASGLSG
jgi:putative intracellular protease/amidase